MSKSRIVQMPVCELVEDLELYPRHAVDDAHVSSLHQSILMGDTLPPIVADSKSKRITDGWHRCRAYARVGPGMVVDVELVNYKDETEMLVDSVAKNATHGRKFDRIDKTRSVVLLEKHGVDIKRISLLLHVPEKKVESYRVKVATAPRSSPGTVPGTQNIALKRPVMHMQGQKLTKQQAVVHQSLPGTSFLLIAKQLRMAIEEGMVDRSDEKLHEMLEGLHAALGEWL